MASSRIYAIGWAALAAAVAPVAGAAEGPVTLREEARAAGATRVAIALKAEGLYRPPPAPGSTSKELPKPLALRVETRLGFVERLLPGGPPRAVRRVLRAAAAINGEVRPSSSVLRPEVALLLAEPGPERVTVTSLGGPLTRAELELVQGPGDPFELIDLLPAQPVAVGETWKVGDGAARGLCAYDLLTSNGLKATLESADEATAKVKLAGEVRGSALGGAGTVACSGTLTFDRKASRVNALTLDRDESRAAGPVEAGLDVKSLLTVTRSEAEVPPELADAVLERVPTGPDPDRERERLLLKLPGGKATVTHGRAWHTYWDDPRLTVLKLVEGGEAVAQCNISVGPNAGKGRHQDLEQFRADIRQGLGPRFAQFLGAGEAGTATGPEAGFRYKVGAQGKQGDFGVVWYYYLLAGPDGDQLLATFTLAASRAEAFGDQDERLIDSARWGPAPLSPSGGR